MGLVFRYSRVDVASISTVSGNPLYCLANIFFILGKRLFDLIKPFISHLQHGSELEKFALYRSGN